MIGIIIDDERKVGDIFWRTYPADIPVVHCKNLRQFKHVLRNCPVGIDYVSFDHDLGEDEPTGYDVVKWYTQYLDESGSPAPKMCFHSQNPVGRNNMRMYHINWLNSRGGK